MRMVFEDGERAALVGQLGLEENVTDEALATAVAERLAQQQQRQRQQQEPPPENDGEFVVVDVAAFQRFRERDRVAAEVEAANALRDRNELVEEAIADGKFGPARREHYRERYDSDPEGTRSLIGRLSKNTVPLEERGKDAPTDEHDQTSYDTSWLPEVAARQQQMAAQHAAQHGNPSRVHGEV